MKGGREKVAAHLRRFGLEGEAAFDCVAYQYALCYADALATLPQPMIHKWHQAYAKVAEAATVVIPLKELVIQDPLGNHLPDWYQFFIGRRYRSDSGKFFTPRTVAAAMARLLPYVEAPVIMDPTCGGGTFLAEASTIWREGPCTLIANDVEPALVELTMLVLSLSSPPQHLKQCSVVNIFDPTPELTQWYGKVDYILANPPFSLKIDNEFFESQIFAAGYRNSDALFMDTAASLLKPGGRLVCLLPHSIVANQEFAALRAIVETAWTMLGVIGLPEGVFHRSAGTTTRADIVMLEKKDLSMPRPDRKLVFASAPSVGVPLNSQAKMPVANELANLTTMPEIQTALQI